MKYKPLLLSPLGLLPVGLQAADAADIQVPVKAPAVAAPYAPLWAGFYGGVYLGGISDRSEATTYAPGIAGVGNWCLADDCSTQPKQTATGVLGGAQIGYNFQAGNIVYGFETDIGLSSARKSTTTRQVTNGVPYTWTADTGIDAFGTARVRLGYSFDRALLYATGGLAYAKVRNTFQGDTGYAWSERAGWRAGWTAGGGIEYAVAPNWSVKFEGLYYDLGTRDHITHDADDYVGLRDKMTGFVGRVGVNYSFR